MPDNTVAGLMIEPTQLVKGPAACVEQLIRLGKRAIATAGIDASAIGAAGISCGGPLDAAAGVLQSPVHLPGWTNIPIVDLVSMAFRVPAVLENDATAGAWGEYRFGAGRGAESMVYLTVSTGIGGGAVLDGRLYYGAAGNGGEFGHQVVRQGGRNGCVEAYASGTAIAERAIEAVHSGRPTSLTRLASVTAADVASIADTDALASELWNEAIDSLGEAVTNLVNILEPSVVVLGGGVTRSGKLLEPVRRAVASLAMGPAARACRVELAQLGQASCVAGAGALAMDRLASIPPLSRQVI
jgi:glucokinase